VKPFYLSNRSTFQIQLVPLHQGGDDPGVPARAAPRHHRRHALARLLLPAEDHRLKRQRLEIDVVLGRLACVGGAKDAVDGEEDLRRKMRSRSSSDE
jgi:hypothetical protein